ncbi:hypothetical protein D3C78_1927790 [compost metagenome]
MPSKADLGALTCDSVAWPQPASTPRAIATENSWLSFFITLTLLELTFIVQEL